MIHNPDTKIYLKQETEFLLEKAVSIGTCKLQTIADLYCQSRAQYGSNNAQGVEVHVGPAQQVLDRNITGKIVVVLKERGVACFKEARDADWTAVKEQWARDIPLLLEGRKLRPDGSKCFSPATINSKFRQVRTFLRWLHDHLGTPEL